MNPRAVHHGNTISSRARYDHFDTSPDRHFTSLTKCSYIIPDFAPFVKGVSLDSAEKTLRVPAALKNGKGYEIIFTAYGFTKKKPEQNGQPAAVPENGVQS